MRAENRRGSSACEALHGGAVRYLAAAGLVRRRGGGECPRRPGLVLRGTLLSTMRTSAREQRVRVAVQQLADPQRSADLCRPAAG